MPLPELDWPAVCRRAAAAARAAVARYPSAEERAVETGQGRGGDTTLVIDQAAEDAIVAELQALDVPLTVVAEERGEVELNGGGATRVVIDPVDGSLNAKRRLELSTVSIAVASGSRVADVEVGVVAALDREVDWWAVRGEGAFRGGEPLPRLADGPLELLGLEGTSPRRLAAVHAALESSGAHRVRALGSLALTMTLVAAGELDGMVGLRPARAVDVAAAQLIVREAGGSVAFPGADGDPPLDLDMRCTVLAARHPALAERLRAAFG